jgi:acetyl esterase
MEGGAAIRFPRERSPSNAITYRKPIMSHMTKTPVAAGLLLVSATTLTAVPVAARQLDPSTQAFVDGLAGSAPLYTLTPHDARAVLTSVQKSVKLDLPASHEGTGSFSSAPTGRPMSV